VAAGSQISGSSITLDSTASTSLDSAAVLRGSTYNLNSGQISILLDDADDPLPGTGLVLTGVPLQNLLSANSLSLLSYSSIDVYGTGAIGQSGLSQLSLSAGEIRGFNQDTGEARFVADNILLPNLANVASGPAAGATS